MVNIIAKFSFICKYRKLINIMQFKRIFNKEFHHWSLIIFLFGFVFDVLILPDFEDIHARYIGLTHLLVVAFFIYLREWVVSKNTASEWERKLFELTTFLISFSSGAALSFIFVYAVRLAEFSVSWPLFLLLVLIITANEFVSTHNFRYALDLCVLFTATLFYIIFNTPMILKEQNDNIFIISLIVSISVSLLYTHILRKASHTANEEAPRGYALAIGIPMFAGMLYFLNVLPAVPLSLKDAGVYHNIVRTSTGEFTGVKEIDNRNFAKYRVEIDHVLPNDNAVYFFSKINTPAEITAPISHTWEKYNDKERKWIKSMTISFDIKGGRNDGYRAYSKKENIEDGLWRVTIKVGANRIVGREKFWVIRGKDSTQTKEIKL